MRLCLQKKRKYYANVSFLTVSAASTKQVIESQVFFRAYNFLEKSPEEYYSIWYGFQIILHICKDVIFERSNVFMTFLLLYKGVIFSRTTIKIFCYLSTLGWILEPVLTYSIVLLLSFQLFNVCTLNFSSKYVLFSRRLAISSFSTFLLIIYIFIYLS